MVDWPQHHGETNNCTGYWTFQGREYCTWGAAYEAYLAVGGPCCSRAKIHPGHHMPSCCNSGATKINLSQQNQAVTSPDRALFAHLSSVTPDVKSGKMRVSPFNDALASASFGKSVDPACYNGRTRTGDENA